MGVSWGGGTSILAGLAGWLAGWARRQLSHGHPASRPRLLASQPEASACAWVVMLLHAAQLRTALPCCRDGILEQHMCRRPTSAAPAALAAKLKWLLQQVAVGGLDRLALPCSCRLRLVLSFLWAVPYVGVPNKARLPASISRPVMLALLALRTARPAALAAPARVPTPKPPQPSAPPAPPPDRCTQKPSCQPTVVQGSAASWKPAANAARQAQ